MTGTWLTRAGVREREERPKALIVAVLRHHRAGEGAPQTETSLHVLRRLAGTDALTTVDEHNRRPAEVSARAPQG